MSPDLTHDLRRLVALAERDLRERSERDDLPWAVALRQQHSDALSAGRTAQSWSEWRDGEVAQGAVAWVLGTVFVRFCEDNDLIARRWIAGPGEGRRLALDAEAAFYRADPRRGAADWLRDAFGHLADLPASGGILDRDHSLVWTVPLGDDTCRELLTYWRETGEGGVLVHSLASPTLDTRFLGDLYQDLSDVAKKKYALLQTPVFVEEFILDRTLTPALAEFGLPGLRLIDPTCGSGHFLLGAFDRLLEAWTEREPGASAGENVRRALDSIHGVDLNPFAAAIARFRLAVAALHATGFTRLSDAPAYPIHVAIGDSLLGGVAQGAFFDDTGAAGFYYPNEDIHEHPRILEPGRYHVVVGNPPYITVKDKALNQAYRALYSTCKGKYALSVPFMELFFTLAIRGSVDQPAGFVGQITSNSFMKREFGSKIIESLLSGRDTRNPVDLLDVIDTSGAYIPGHGTPTVILVGRRRRPAASTVRAVLGVRGEPGQPENPAKGLVWTQIVEHIDSPDFDGTFVSVTDLDRDVLKTHPWSLSGGGAGDVKESMDFALISRVGDGVFRLGVFGIMGADDAFMRPTSAVGRGTLEGFRSLVVGDQVRDYAIRSADPTFFPYDGSHNLKPLEQFPHTQRQLWRLRTELGNRATFGNSTYFLERRPWYEWHQLPKDVGAHSWTIAFAEVATHNHFVLDRGGKVFKQTAPVVRLPTEATEDDHLSLIGVLNSSAALFWLRQVCFNKGGDKQGSEGARVIGEPWEDRYAINASNVAEMPLPDSLPLEWGRRLDSLAQQLSESTPTAVCTTGAPSRATLDAAHAVYERTRGEMIAAQEELDWDCYRLYGLILEDLTNPGAVPSISLGERAFEIALARRVAAGEEDTAWFDRHGSTPITEIPANWPEDYRATVQRRLDAMESVKAIRLLERPEFKRRWAADSWEVMERRSVSDWILDRLEDPALWSDAQGPRVRSVAQVAMALRHDSALIEAARVLTGAQDPNLQAIIAPLVADQAVPYLAALRYTDSGLRKRAEWENVWALQRREDAGEKVTIPVPPKYATKDFATTSYWKARGKLDVPKERFISYPGCEAGADTSMVIGWAGWDHAEQARALARLLVERVAEEAWDAKRQTPVLAGLAELEPWLEQWHASPEPPFPISPAEAIRGVLDAHLGGVQMTRADVAAWRPPAKTPKKKTKKGTGA